MLKTVMLAISTFLLGSILTFGLCYLFGVRFAKVARKSKDRDLAFHIWRILFNSDELTVSEMMKVKEWLNSKW